MAIFTGAEYREAYRVLPIVAAGVMLYGISQIAGNGLAMYKKTVIMMQNTFVAARSSGDEPPACPPVRVRRGAWNTFGSYLLLLTLAWFRSRPYMEWKLPWADLARIIGAGAIMAGVLFAAFRWFDAAIWLLAAEAAVGLIAYALALRMLNGLRPDELEFFGEMWAAIRRRLHLA